MTGDRPVSSPTAHGRPAPMVYDTIERREILYGSPANTVWTMAIRFPGLQSWVRLEAEGEPPPPIPGAVIAYDEADHRLLVLGELEQRAVPKLGLWALGLSAPPRWQMLGELPSTISGPPVFATYDRAGARLLAMFRPASGGARLDVWSASLDGRLDWTHLGTIAASDPETIIFDPLRQRFFTIDLPGGETFSYALAAGLSVAEPHPPAPPADGAPRETAVYDAANDQIVLHGLGNGGVWGLGLADPNAAWSSLFDQDFDPVDQPGASTLYDPDLHALLVYSGVVDAWIFWIDEQRAWFPKWERIVAQPRARYVERADMDWPRTSLAYDRDRSRLLLGQPVPRDGALRFEPWMLELPEPPLARAHRGPEVSGRPCLIYDRGRRRYVLSDSEQLWIAQTDPTYEESLDWRELTPATDRRECGQLFDQRRDRLISIAGGPTLRVSAISFASGVPFEWRDEAQDGAPVSAGWGCAAAIDPEHARAIVVAGGEVPEVWALHFGESALRWEQLEVSGPKPPPTRPQSVVVDAELEVLLMDRGVSVESSSGLDTCGTQDDLWMLDLAGPLQWRRVAQRGARPALGGLPVATDDGVIVWSGDNLWALEPISCE